VSLRDFVTESNRIEGIDRAPTETELNATRAFLTLPRIGVGHLEQLVSRIAQASLRDQPGMEVRVGSHLPPRGGQHIRSELTALLTAVADNRIDPYRAHLGYEGLHPFMDGNGRSGRALWAWQMQRDGLDPFALPFLHRFYYQALDASSPRSGTATSE
jgi:hypothetical protein